jgi:hypothetical protein
MSNILLWLVTALYAGQVGVALWNKEMPQAMILGGYVFANIGLIWSFAK